MNFHIDLPSAPPHVFFDVLMVCGVMFMMIGGGYFISSLFMRGGMRYDTMHNFILGIVLMALGAFATIPVVMNTSEYNALLMQQLSEEKNLTVPESFNYRMAYVGTSYETNKGTCYFSFPQSYPGELSVKCRK